MERFPKSQKKKILMDIIANLEDETSFQEIQEIFESGAEASVSLDTVKEAAEKLDRKEIISIKSGKILPRTTP